MPDAPEPTSSSTTIRQFWDWWAAARHDITAAIDDGNAPDVAGEVSNHVSSIDPHLQWEFAKGISSRHSLVITPAGDPRLRAQAYRVIAAAPEADETFEYHASRQSHPDAVNFGLVFNDVRVQLGEMEAIAEVEHDRKLVHVALYHPRFAALGEAAKQVAYLYLDWLLGEEEVERWIGAIDVVDERPAEAVPATDIAGIVGWMAKDTSDDSWALLQGRVDGAPIMVTARRPLKAVSFPTMDQHIAVTVPFEITSPNDLAPPDVLEGLRDFEDALVDQFPKELVLAAHETTKGVRTFHFFADSESGVGHQVQDWCGLNYPEAVVEIAWDPAWEAVQPFA